MLLTFLPLLLGGCTGGQEIESSLFVIAMAVDAAPEGNLTITVKALSGSQESAASGASGAQSEAGSTENLEQTETGYIVLSATAPSCLRALGLLGATTPRTVNLSQLQEIVISQTLAETDATLSILKQIHAIYRANDEAVVVVTPDHAGDFIRRQRAVLGLRLSKYLEVCLNTMNSLTSSRPARISPPSSPPWNPPRQTRQPSMPRATTLTISCCCKAKQISTACQAICPERRPRRMNTWARRCFPARV